MALIEHSSLKSNATVSELADFYSKKAFQAGKLAKAAGAVEGMVREKNHTNYLAMAGAIVPAGMRGILGEMVDEGWIDVVVSTGANLTHDLQISLGKEEYFEYKGNSDQELREAGTSRLYDIITPDESGVVFEKKLQDILSKVHVDLKGKNVSSAVLMHEIGRHIEDKDSFVRKCFENNVPLFVPAIDDSILGFQVWMFWQEKKIVVDAMENLQEIIDIAYDARANDKSTGLIILGGGVPKNYCMQAALFADHPHKYVVQISLDREETGGLSGASLEEAISWGKTTSKSTTVFLTSEVTIALPVIFGAVRDRLLKGMEKQ
ncbi:MAG: deoxyhypusine synthase family protein [Candidatus Diapherotrites archaeon]|nr:deoxyhypusine synthase family protein [Candidatus Diapherotrites archaeon]